MSEQILTVVAKQVAESVVVLGATGDIDRDSQSILDDAASTAVESGSDRLIIDLSGVSFCDSSGLSLFVRLYRRTAARGGWLGLASPQPMVRTVLDVGNFERLFTVYPTVDEAVRAALASG
jgi:anti-anti-sigma factor